jgi:putative ABC transport system substrate-binding protein
VVSAIKQAAPALPIIMVNSSDPVGSGLIATLARPGGNVTGITNLSPEIGAKRLELLKEAVPVVVRVAYLWNPNLAGAAAAYRELEAAARKLDLELRTAEARRAEDIEPALAALAAGPASAMLVQAPNSVLYTERNRIARLAREKRLPSMFNRWEYVAAGGLMSYGPNVPQMYRRAASYVDAILKGASPGELPVEQPSAFELAVNTQTAKSLGIAIPRSLLLRADRSL